VDTVPCGTYHTWKGDPINVGKEADNLERSAREGAEIPFSAPNFMLFYQEKYESLFELKCIISSLVSSPLFSNGNQNNKNKKDNQ